MELILHCLTAKIPFTVFGFWLGLVSSRPLAHPVIYLRKVKLDAAPKCISGRTSYLRVRLAFYPYPQLIPAICNLQGFGPPRNTTFASTWPRVAHTVSGLRHATELPYSDSLSLRLRISRCLTLRQRLTRRLILQ